MVRAALLAALMVGCGYPEIEGARRFEGRHVTVYADPIFPLCPASLELADKYLESVAALLEVPVPQVSYYLYNGSPGGCHVLGTENADCSSRGSVYAGTWIQYHELVHAVSWDLGDPPAFLIEGLAEGLGLLYPLLTSAERQEADVVGSLDSVLFFAGSERTVARRYQVAGDFVVYLLRRFGTAAVLRLYGSLLYLSDSITTRRAFADILGESLDDVVSDWRDWMPRATDEPPLPLDAIRCGAAPLDPIAPDRFQLDGPLACIGGGTRAGGYLDQSMLRTVDAAARGLYQLRAYASGGIVKVSVAGCGLEDHPLDALAFAEARWSIMLGPLLPGRHSVELVPRQPLDDAVAPPSARVELTSLGPESGDCSAAPTFTAPDIPWLLWYSSPPDAWPGRVDDAAIGTAAVSWLRLDAPAASVLVIAWTWPYGSVRPASIRLCSGSCTASSNCATLVPASRSLRWEPTPGEPILLELRAAPDAAPIGFLMNPA